MNTDREDAMTRKQRKNRRQKAILLIAAMESAQLLASDRSKSSDSKAGFLAVTAGILVANSVLPSDSHLAWWISGIPTLLSLAAIALALWALKIRSRPITKMDALVEKWWVAQDKSATELEDLVVRFKARDVEETERSTSERIRFTKYGFYALAAALFSTAALFVINHSII